MYRDVVEISHPPGRMALASGGPSCLKASPGSRLQVPHMIKVSVLGGPHRGFWNRPGYQPERASRSRWPQDIRGGKPVQRSLKISCSDKFHHVFTDCLYVAGSYQAWDPKLNKGTAGLGKQSWEHHPGKRGSRWDSEQKCSESSSGAQRWVRGL